MSTFIRSAREMNSPAQMWMELIRIRSAPKLWLLYILSVSLCFLFIAGDSELISSSRLDSLTKGERDPTAVVERRRLMGPGSSPPRCSAKCGQCTPCRAVRVAVPPGTSVPTEYYPEAWRCKCGNRLYMP